MKRCPRKRPDFYSLPFMQSIESINCYNVNTLYFLLGLGPCMLWYQFYMPLYSPVFKGHKGPHSAEACCRMSIQIKVYAVLKIVTTILIRWYNIFIFSELAFCNKLFSSEVLCPLGTGIFDPLLKNTPDGKVKTSGNTVHNIELPSLLLQQHQHMYSLDQIGFQSMKLSTIMTNKKFQV